MAERQPELVGNPTPIGLMGLAMGCAALAPVELGVTEATDPRVWIWMLAMGGVLQIYAGVADLVNRNVLGATSFTVYGMLWLVTACQFGSIAGSDPTVKAYIYLGFLAFTLYMMVGFMTVSMTLTIVFALFVVIFAVEILAGFLPFLHHFASRSAGVLHALAAVLATWAAAGGVINGLLGRNLFKQGEPPLRSATARPDDFASLGRHAALRREIVTAMYRHWEANGWEWLSTRDLCDRLGRAPAEIAPDSWYLYQKGYLALDEERLKAEPEAPKLIRLTAAGVDHYRELQMGKFKF